MDIYNIFPFQAEKKKRAIALGFFDGVHLGHQQLLKQLLTISKQKAISPAIFTFQNHPKTLLQNSDKFEGLIQSLEMRLEKLQTFNVEEAFVVQMDEKFRHISAEDFYFHILCETLQIEALIVGQDTHFGYLGKGNIEKLKKWTNETNVELYVMPDMKIDGIKVSSTYIRQLLKEGNIHLTNRCLGSNYQINGKVIHGKKLGRTLGFPTINLTYDENLISPKYGVYMTRVILNNKKYPAITSIGTNPTVEEINRNVKVETYIYDQSFDLYDEIVNIEFIDFIRPEYKFPTVEEMTKRVLIDLDLVKERHENNHY